jgi:hypothetical protein
MNDTMASVLLSLVRIAIRIEHAASMLLVLDDTALRATGWHAPVPFVAALDLTLRALRPTPATPQ